MNEPQRFQFRIPSKKGVRKFYFSYFWDNINYIGKPKKTNK